MKRVMFFFSLACMLVACINDTVKRYEFVETDILGTGGVAAISQSKWVYDDTFVTARIIYQEDSSRRIEGRCECDLYIIFISDESRPPMKINNLTLTGKREVLELSTSDEVIMIKEDGEKYATGRYDAPLYLNDYFMKKNPHKLLLRVQFSSNGEDFEASLPLEEELTKVPIH